MSTEWKYESLDQNQLDFARERKPRRLQRHLGIAALGLGAICLGGFYVHQGNELQLPDTSRNAVIGAVENPLSQCPSNLPPHAKPPAPTNPWSSLTVDDTTEITRWLESDKVDLNLTQSHIASLSDNYIFHIDALRPAKADALAYLASPEDVTPPQRFARVTVHHGSAAEPYIQDYRVGPLPCTGEAMIEPLTEIYHRDPIPYHARGFLDPAELTPLAHEIITPLANITQVRARQRCRCMFRDWLLFRIFLVA
jgi:primary-amine oxidase